MAGLRKGHCYTVVKRAYTRKSKFKTKGYIKAIPQSKINRYEMGDVKKAFPYRVKLMSRDPIQVRHNALESGRLVVNRRLSIHLGNNFFFKVRVYPHHVLRENKMITGAGADRMQTGMQKAFGRAVGIAAQLRKEQIIYSVDVDETSIAHAKDALHKAVARLPGKYRIEVEKISA
jgi:large subunit ribosomal protein L10e